MQEFTASSGTNYPQEFTASSSKVHQEQGRRGFFHGRLIDAMHKLTDHSPEVKQVVGKAQAANVPWSAILTKVAPLIIPLVVDIISGNWAAVLPMVPQIVAAILSLIPAQAH